MGAELHRVLARQLLREGLDPERPPTSAAAWAAFLARVDRAYRDADEERYTTERSQAISSRELSALRERAVSERDKLRAVLSALPVSVLELDAAGGLVFANPAAEALLGALPTGTPLGERVTLLDARGEPVAVSGASAEADGAVRVGSGTPIPAAWSVSSMPGDAGGHVVTVTDHTDRFRVQQELTEAKVDAEVARRSERTRASFLASVSHELRTPLNAIIGYAELLRDDLGDPTSAVEDLDRILTSSRHLLHLIDDVLDLSRIDAGRLELHFEEVDLARLLADVADATRPIAARNGTEVRVEGEGLGTVRTDALRLRQCLLNLASNAAKFTRAGEVVLGGERGPRAVSVWVRDTGIGIAPEYLPRLFRPFTQGEPGAVRRFGGTGLGLAITRAFAERLGGGVDVESRLGAGSTFRIQLPLRPELAPEAPAPADRRERGRGDGVVLVVDDDPVVVELVAHALAQEPVRVVGVSSAEAGLYELLQERPRAVVLDVRLPGANGWSLLSTIRSDPSLASLPVAVVTSGDDVRATIERLRADTFVQKPLEKVVLRDALRGLLRRTG